MISYSFLEQLFQTQFGTQTQTVKRETKDRKTRLYRKTTIFQPALLQSICHLHIDMIETLMLNFFSQLSVSLTKL